MAHSLGSLDNPKLRAFESVCVDLRDQTVSCGVRSTEAPIEPTDWFPFYDRLEERSFLLVCPGVCDEVVVCVWLSGAVA